jgi:LmbE family N-acetylglucosaminyl deacetylase
VVVLVVAPHPDDESLGCGGTICTHVARGDRVAVAFLTSGECALDSHPQDTARRIREREAAKAAEVLGVAGHHFLRIPDSRLDAATDEAGAALHELFVAERPELVYVPHEGEGHRDHAAALAAVRAAVSRPGTATPSLLAYEIWTPLAHFDRVVDIGEHIATKLQAVRKYRSQIRGWRYDLAIKGLNAYRGVMFGRCAFAEVFATVSPQ